MKENKYNNSHFFSQYSQMSRSVEGLKGAGEWHVLQKMLEEARKRNPSPFIEYQCMAIEDFELRRPMMLLISAKKKK